MLYKLSWKEMNIGFILLSIAVVLLFQCSPKQNIIIKDVATEEVKTVVDEGPCATWNYLDNKEDIIEMHVIYRDLMKLNKFEEALPYWQRVFKTAPFADGRRMTHFDDGVKIYYHFYDDSVDGTQRSIYKSMILDTIFGLRRQCAEKPGHAAGQEAFDLYYNYQNLVSKREIYDRFKLAIDESGEKTAVFVLNPFTRVLVDLFEDNQLDTLEALEYANKIRKTLKYGLDNCAPKCEDWEIVKSYTPVQLERLERVRGFYDCAYYKEKYLAQFDDYPDSCDIIETAYIRLKWGECDNTDPELLRVLEAKNKLCKRVTTNVDLKSAKDCLENGNYDCAIQNYQNYLDNTDDSDKKAKYLLRIAKIYYAHLKNFPMSRQFALKAAKIKSNWGEPYMLIGSLYASSGPLCGPGTGWDSQIVTWPAIDKWKYAKKIDPSVVTKANKLVNRYTKYMPSREDIFLRQIKEGSRFKINCWINETTIVRVN